MVITRLRINGIKSPMGYNFDVLNVSWHVEESAGKRAEQILVEVAEDEGFETIIDTKAGADHSCTGTQLDIELMPRSRYFVRVTVTDECGETGCGTTWFETGKLNEAWEAEWIGMEEEDTFHPILHKQFSLQANDKSKDAQLETRDALLKKPVKARLYICGVGLYEAYLNGRNVSEEVLAPFLNDYRFALQTQTYDVTDLLEEKNTFEVLLGNGWYKGRFGMAGHQYGERFAAIAELHICYEDGSREVIKTDESWKYRGSEIEDSGIYDGEVLNQILWKKRENNWKAVKKVDLDKSFLTDRYSIRVLVKEKVSVKEIIETPAGETVLDMGQNFTGWMVFKNKLPEGTKLHLDFGEVLQSGCFYNENYRTATGGFTFISGGQPANGIVHEHAQKAVHKNILDADLIRPRFTFFGFRYVKVSGWVGKLEKDDFTGYAIYSDLEQTGFLETSDARINQLYSNCLWGQKSNFLDMPTDCPQRDERLGWTADAQVFAPTATYNMDTRAFYRKYLWDMRNVQKTLGGGVPAFLPASEEMCPICSVWGDAASFIPYTVWKFYACPEEMESFYPLIKDWVDYVSGEMIKQYGTEVGIWDFSFHFGDWLALDGLSEQAVKGGTPDGYLATVYYFKSTSILAEIAEKLGKVEDQTHYQEQAYRIKEHLLFEYVTPAGHLSVNTQAAFIVALKFGIYREKEVLLQDFLDLLKSHQYRIKCGFVGAPMLCQVLSENGHSELAYKFLFQEGFPSWLYAVNMGATTIWERWNSILPDGSISGTGMNSLNHYSYGSVIEFLYAYAAGLRPKESGFATTVIEPCPNYRMRWLNCTYNSPAGQYVVNWKLEDNGNLWLHLEIPFGCKAAVMLPESGKKAFEVGAGSYEYEYMPLQDYRKKYSKKSFLKEIFADAEAMDILLTHIPSARALVNPLDEEEELSVLYERPFMGIQPEDADQVIAELEELRFW